MTRSVQNCFAAAARYTSKLIFESFFCDCSNPFFGCWIVRFGGFADAAHAGANASFLIRIGNSRSHRIDGVCAQFA